MKLFLYYYEQINLLYTQQKLFLFQKEWFEGYQLASAMNFKFPQFKRLMLNTIVPNASRDGIHLMELLLSWNPIRRPSAQSALRCLKIYIKICKIMNMYLVRYYIICQYITIYYFLI